MKYKLSPAPFLTISSKLALPTIAKLKSLHGVLEGRGGGVNFPNGPIPFWLASPHMITSKSPHSTYMLLYSKSYKYDKYDKTTYRVSPFC